MTHNQRHPEVSGSRRKSYSQVLQEVHPKAQCNISAMERKSNTEIFGDKDLHRVIQILLETNQDLKKKVKNAILTITFSKLDILNFLLALFVDY